MQESMSSEVCNTQALWSVCFSSFHHIAVRGEFNQTAAADIIAYGTVIQYND